MKLAIVTFHWANNYGALLQAYGLRRTFEKMGHSVQFLDYAPPHKRVPWWRPLGLRQGRGMLAMQGMKRRCAQFRKNHLPATRRGDGLPKVEAICWDEGFDAIVAGSDQIWNGYGAGGRYNPVYFLDFALPKQCRRISYSACFGQADQPEETCSRAGPALRRFDALSVRNEVSREWVRKLSGRDAVVTLDPTLLDDYAELVPEPATLGNYICVYSLGREFRETGEKIAARARQRLGLPIVTLYPDGRFRGAERRELSAGPIEWMRWLKGSGLVVTNSFHGTVFALKFGKPFISWVGSRPERLRDLLRRTGADERLVVQYDSDAIDALCDRPVPRNGLDAERQQSQAFLEKALS